MLVVVVLAIALLALIFCNTDMQRTALRVFDGALQHSFAPNVGARTAPAPRPRRQIPQSVRVNVWGREFGANARVGKCTVCRKPIDLFTFQAGHIISQAAGGSDALDNLTPVCAACNLSMGTEDLNEYRRRYYAH